LVMRGMRVRDLWTTHQPRPVDLISERIAEALGGRRAAGNVAPLRRTCGVTR
jgi:hypothetical protein